MIGLYGCVAGSNIVVHLDDTTLDDDVDTSLWGDVDGDGVVTTADAVVISDYAVGLPVPNLSLVLARGDVNNDGVVNIKDAQQVARYVAGLPTLRVGTPIGHTPIEAYLVTAPLTAGAWSTLRRISQHVKVGGAVVIVLTPVADDSLHTGQAATKALDPSDGGGQMTEAAVQAGCTTFAYRLDVAMLGGPLEIGATEFLVVPRRSTRGT